MLLIFFQLQDYLIFRDFSRYEAFFFVGDLIDLFAGVSFVRCLSIKRTYWFEYQFYRGLFVNMQPYTWYYFITYSMPSEDFVQVFSFH